MSRTRSLALLLAAVALLAGCADDDQDRPSAGEAAPPPEWIQDVYPTPGAVAPVPDAVEIRYTPREPTQIVRLVIDGVDVTTYALHESGLIRYESGTGPVALESNQGHEVEVLLTEAPTPDATTFTVVESWSFSFRSA